MATRRGAGRARDWPLGAYLRDARGSLSIRGAAKKAAVSESRWRQVEAGVQRVAGGIDVPVHPRPETVVAMARAVSADPRRALELAGHNPDQWEGLLEADVMPDRIRTEWFASLPREDRERVLAQLQRVHVDVEVKRSTG